MNGKSAVSVIVPCYNEEAIITHNVTRLRSAMDQCTQRFEIVLCNDGSTDTTLPKIQQLAQQYSNVKVVSYADNRGAGYAFRQGLQVAEGDYIIHMDADLAMEPAEVCQRFLAELKHFDLVIASRYKGTKADYPLRRRLPSAAYSLLYRWLLKLPIRDAMSGFFSFRRSILKVIPPLEMNGFEIYLEFFLKAKVNGFTIKEIPAKFKHETASGEVSVLAYGPAQLVNTLRVWKRYKAGSKTGIGR